MAEWHEDVRAAFSNTEVVPAADRISHLGVIQYSVVMSFAEPPAVGHAVGEVLRVDRAFRYAGRSFITAEPLPDLLARGGRPLYIVDGMRWTAQDIGSVRTRLDPGVKLLAGGLAVAVSAVALLTGGITVYDRVTGERADEPMGPAEVFVPQQFPVETTIELEVRSGDKVTTVRYRRIEGWRYAPLPEIPPKSGP